MKTEKIIWGLVLVFIGGILLLQNFGMIDFQWLVIWRFWPLILILIGANMLFSRENSRAGAAVSVLLTVAALAFIGWQGSLPDADGDGGLRWSYRFKSDDDKPEPADAKVHNNVFNEEYIPGTKNAILNISGGATTYILKDTTASLFNARVASSYGDYSLEKVSKDSIETLNFKMSDKESFRLDGKGPNDATMAMNTGPVWDINVETGAGKTDFDLSAFKIRKITFQGGATKMNLKLGMPLENTEIKIETGVSKISIQVPASAACRVNTDSGLSSNDFEGFEKQSDNSWVTPGFNKASKKMTINLEGGLSKFNVSRY